MKREIDEPTGMTLVTASARVAGFDLTAQVVVGADIAKRLQMVAYQGEYYVELRLVDGATIYAVTRQHT